MTDGKYICCHCKQVSDYQKRCGRCKKVNYCDTVCQRADWVHHQHHCTPVSGTKQEESYNSEQSDTSYIWLAVQGATVVAVSGLAYYLLKGKKENQQ